MVYYYFITIGANRLGANSLLDIVVFGKMASITARNLVEPNTPHPQYSKNLGEETIQKIDRLRYSKGDLPTATIRNQLQRTMQNHAAVFRIEKTMQEGITKVYDALSMFNHVGISDRVIIYITFSH